MQDDLELYCLHVEFHSAVKGVKKEVFRTMARRFVKAKTFIQEALSLSIICNTVWLQISLHIAGTPYTPVSLYIM